MPESFSWIDVDGNEFPFASSIFPEWGMSNLDSPPARAQRDTLAGQSGTVLQLVEDDLATFSVPVLVDISWFGITDDNDFTYLRSNVQDWAHRMDPTRGPGRLRFYRADGTYRERYCICVDGWRFTESTDTSGPGWIETVLQFEADDPAWYGDTGTQTWSIGGSTIPKWFNPPTSKRILPIQLGKTTVSGNTTVIIASDMPVWPIWDLSGPGTNVTLENTFGGTTHSLVWDFAAYTSTGGIETFNAGDHLVIDTRPGFKTIELNGDNAYGGLTSYDLWALQPGTNTFTVLVSDSDANTEATATWQNRYRTR